jgi:hypothetical protein
MAGREIVEADDPLVRPQQRLGEVGTDEPGRAGDQPGAGPLGERGRQIFAEDDLTPSCAGWDDRGQARGT